MTLETITNTTFGKLRRGVVVTAFSALAVLAIAGCAPDGRGESRGNSGPNNEKEEECYTDYDCDEVCESNECVTMGGDDGPPRGDRVSFDFQRANVDGVAFSGTPYEIIIRDSEGSPVPRANVKYFHGNVGDAYLTKGGMAAFPKTGNKINSLDQSLQGERILEVRSSGGVTLFDRDEREVLFDLIQWNTNYQYVCDGIFTTEQLIEGRDQTVQLISYFDQSGTIKFVYDSVQGLMDRGLVDDLQAGKKWIVLLQDNPMSIPMHIQRDLAEDAFGRNTYDEMKRNCPDRTGSGDGRFERVNGRIRDNETGFLWTDSWSGVDLYDAIDHCQGQNGEWVLPSVGMLRNLQGNGSCGYASGFPDAECGKYWAIIGGAGGCPLGTEHQTVSFGSNEPLCEDDSVRLKVRCASNDN
jgi:hypothetical protein